MLVSKKWCDLLPFGASYAIGLAQWALLHRLEVVRLELRPIDTCDLI
jgi:hypothetical protein